MTWTGDSIPFADASAIVSAQHESYDGTGFPRGLKGEVPLGSRVLRIAAAFDALVTGRPASGTISIPAAKEEILRIGNPVRSEDLARRWNFGFIRRLHGAMLPVLGNVLTKIDVPNLGEGL